MEMREYIRELANGFRSSVVLLAANEAGIFEALGDRSLTVAEIAAASGNSERGVDIVLHALAALGLLEKHGERFSIAEKARPYLLPDSPQRLTDMLRHDYNLLQRWLRLPEVLRTGRPVPRDAGTEPWSRRNFIGAMANLGSGSGEAFARAVDLSDVHHLLDLGGGPAMFAIALCRAYPHLRVTVFDREDTIAIAHENLQRAGMQDRITLAAGDFFHDPLPEKCDAALLSSVVHIFGPEENLELLRRVHAVLPPGGKIFIRDFILSPDRTGPTSAALFAVNMLVNTERGRCYTEEEVRGWMEEVGMQPTAVVALSGASQIVAGRKPR